MYMKSIISATVCAVTLSFAAPQTQAADYSIKFAHNNPPLETSSYHRYYKKFAELAAKYTDGKVEFREFPSSQMGSDQQMAKKLQLGSIEMIAVAANNLAQLYGGFDLFTLPFLIKSPKCAVQTVLKDEKLIRMISEGAQKKANIRVLAFSNGGARNMMNSKHPILSPADLKGLRMRVAKNPILLDTYAALGADAIGISAAETYGALQTKVVDGHDGGTAWAFAQKLHEVQNFYSLTCHQLVTLAVIINNDYFEKLPADVQAGITKAAKEAAAENMEWMLAYESKVFDTFKDAGLKFSSPDLAPFQNAVSSVWEKYAERVGGKDVIDYVKGLQGSCS